MIYVVSFSKFLWVLLALLTLPLALSLGCGAGDNPAQSAGPATGSEEGKRIVPFSLRLADGTIVTSTEILDRNRPTFLLFHQHP